ncbi:MAG: TolC family protein, partial [Candidatus Aminicenantes bacterium]|nr:TolC family protein [Candidatus Aminicenantes bacterium]
MKRIAGVFSLIILLALPGLAQEQKTLALTLEDVIARALKNNLDLQIEMSNPEISQALLDKSSAIFVPTLALDFGRTSTTTPSSSIFTGADVEKADSGTLGFTLTQKLLLGGNLSVTLDNSRNSTNSVYSKI